MSIGIVTAHYAGYHVVYLLVGIIALLLILFFLREEDKNGNWVFVVSVMAFFFSVGALSLSLKNEKISFDIPTYSLYHGIIQDYPIEKSKNLQCKISLFSYEENDSLYSCQKELIAYIPKDEKAASFQPGDVIVFQSHLNLLNAEEEQQSYVRYLWLEGYGATTYIPSDCWRLMDTSAIFNIRYEALKWRKRLSCIYVNQYVESKIIPLLLAMTLGDKGLLDKETKEYFSSSGTSHLLAVSGLHVGIILIILGLLLNRNKCKAQSSYLKDVLLLIAVWIYAFMTGLSPSVVRTVIMFTFFIIGNLMSRQQNTFHTYYLSAFCMLIYNPLYLFNISFQLSYAALFFILWLQPYLDKLWHFSNIFFCYFWGIITVSMAAQMGTFPLVYYYFQTFPPFFLLSNMVLIPFSFVLLGCSIFGLLTAWISPISNCFLFIASIIAEFMYIFTQFIYGLPHSLLNFSKPSEAQVVCLYLMIFGFVCWLIYKERKGVITSLAAILFYLVL